MQSASAHTGTSRDSVTRDDPVDDLRHEIERRVALSVAQVRVRDDKSFFRASLIIEC